ncbi:MAG: YSC84-like protein 1 [Blastocatellia bacterium]|nr:YSC84-like protein 1 [Blastocatellia bacterium]
MNHYSIGRVVGILTIVLVTCVLGIPTFAQKKGKKANEATQRSNDAATVFNEIMGAADNGIPKELIDKAQAIAVFPGVLKAAFIFGGREGKGVISRRTDAGWTAPAFFNLGGGSFGAQIGADKTDYVLLVMNESGLAGLLGDKFEIGGEVGVAAGPVGREASAATDAQLKAEILTYSRTKGLFAGVALKGTAITPDNDLNEAFYGMKARDVLNGVAGRTPASVSIFPETLSRY